MDVILIILVLLLPFLVLVVATCSASETTFFSMTRTDRFRLRRRNPSAGTATAHLLSRPRTLVLSILLITTAGNVAFYVIVSILERRLSHGVIGAAFNIAVLLGLVLLGDLLPKLLAASNPVRMAQVLAKPLDLAVRVVAPQTRFLESWFVSPTLRLIRTEPGTSARSVSVDELGALLELSARSGEIEQDEQKLLADIIRLGSTRVRDVMIPRVAMPWVSDRYTPTDVARVLKRSAVDRLPVFRGSPDGRVLGFLDVRSYLTLAEVPPEPRQAGGREAKTSEFERPLYIPERARLDQLLELLRLRHAEQALCVDEYGAVVGMVTVNEILRELVAATPGVEALSGGDIERRSATCWVIPGRLPARELAAQLGEVAPRHASESVSTVAGLFFQRLGRIPSEGDTIRLGNVELKVESMSGRSINRVAVALASPQEASA